MLTKKKHKEPFRYFSNRYQNVTKSNEKFLTNVKINRLFRPSI